jgi:hypothetical protein
MEPAVADLRAMPRSDAVFGRVARRLAEDSTTPVDLEARLRAFFPLAVVRERTLSHEPRVLYIYRDGRYLQDRAEPWWRTEAVATVAIDIHTGRVVSASPSWASFLRESADWLVGKSYAELVGPEALVVADVVFATILELGEVTSEALLRRSEGSAMPFEFHAERVGDRIEIAYRPLRA